MHVGIPVMKCSLHPSTQVNKRTGKAAKTCGVGSAWREMNDDRLGRDTTIDKNLTYLNVWMEGETSDNIEQIVQDEIDEINAERKDIGLRSLRSDAVSVAEIVEKPPIDFMQNLSYEERKEFLQKSHETMEDLIHEWNPDWKIIAAVQHHDEFGGLSAHNHELVLLSSHDKNGVATMQAKSELNLKFFNYINTHYAERMREFGYPVEDVKTYDRLSEEEKEERKLHPAEHGVEAYVYKQKKKEEMAVQIQSMTEEHEQIKEELQESKEELSRTQKQTSEAKVELEETKQRIGNLKNEKTELSQAKEHYERQAAYLTEKVEAPSLQKYEAVVNENQNLKEELSWKDRVIEKLQEEKIALQATVEKLSATVQKMSDTFYEIAHKAGQRLMQAFGYDMQQDPTVQEYPNADISSAMATLKEEVEQYDTDFLRVIPDHDHPGTYQVACRKSSGKYETVKAAFSSREEAEDFRRNFGHAAENLTDKFEENWSDNFKIK